MSHAATVHAEKNVVPMHMNWYCLHVTHETRILATTFFVSDFFAYFSRDLRRLRN